MTTKSRAAYKACRVYVYQSNEELLQASSRVYADPREIRKLYDCIRKCVFGAADCVLTETLEGFRIEVFQ